VQALFATRDTLKVSASGIPDETTPLAGSVRITFPTDRPEEATIVGRARAHFRVRFGGLFVGSLPDSIPGNGLLRRALAIPASEGSAFEFQVAPEVQGFRVEPASRGGAVDVVLSRDAGSGFEHLAPEGPLGPPQASAVRRSSVVDHPRRPRFERPRLHCHFLGSFDLEHARFYPLRHDVEVAESRRIALGKRQRGNRVVAPAPSAKSAPPKSAVMGRV
jgi:hypothetical protein